MSLYCINLSRAQLTEIICHCERNHKMLNGRTQRGGPGNEWLHSLPPLLFCPSSSLGCAPARARSQHRGINCFFRLGGKCLLLPVLSLAFFFSTPSAPSLSLIGFTKLPSLNPFIKNHQSVSQSVSIPLQILPSKMLNFSPLVSTRRTSARARKLSQSSLMPRQH